MTWKNKSWLAFDFEATGTDPLTDRVWQCGAALQAQRGRDPVRKSVWVNPQRDYSVVKRELHLTPNKCAQIDAAAPWKESSGVLDFVRAVQHRHIVAGWNCGPWTTKDAGGYDGPLLACELERAQMPQVRRPLIDVMMLACQLLEPRPASWQQPTVAAHLGIEFEGQAHRADADAQVTLQILERLAPKLPDDLEELYALVERACGWSWWIRETPGGLELNCGQHRGMALSEAAKLPDFHGRQGGYLRWALGLDGIPTPTREAFRGALEK